MMRRGRIGRPGLIGTAARTAVIAGTASAVVGGVTDRRRSRAEASAVQQQAELDAAVDRRMAQAPPPPPPQAGYPPPPQPAPAPAPAPQTAPAGGADDVMDQLQRLADMKAQGLLSDAEFTALKAKLIADG